MAGYFPYPPYPQGKSRQAFAGYGSHQNIAVIPAGTFGESTTSYPQHHHTDPHPLSAHLPALPLLPPSQVRDLFSEPCTRHNTQQRKVLQHKLSQLQQFSKRMCKGEKSYRDNLRKFADFVENLEDELGPDVKRSDLTSSQAVDFNLELARTPPWFPSLVDRCADIIGQDVFVPKVNASYSGGNISCTTIPKNTSASDIGLIMYPSGQDLDEVSLAAVETCDDVQGLKLRYKSSVDLKDGGPILQIEINNTQNSLHSIIRQAKSFHFLDVPYDNDNYSPPTVTYTKQWEDSGPTHACLSPYIAGEYCVTTSDGTLYHGVRDRLDLICDNIHPRFACGESWLCVDWGAHPRQVYVADRTAADLYDLRCQGGQVGTVFSLPHSLLHSGERIMAAKSHEQDRFYLYIATDYHLIMVDQRFPNHPVLHWEHSLLTPPTCLQSVPTSPDQQHVLLASQQPAEVHVFSMKLGDEASPPQALGICSLQHGSDLSVFQISSQGDLFHQTFSPTTSSQDKTWNAGPGSMDLKLSDEALEYSRTWLSQGKDLYQAATKQTVSGTSLDASAPWLTLSQQVYPHMLCVLCNSQAQHLMTEASQTQSQDECMACGLKLAFGQKLKSAIEDQSVMPSQQDDITVPSVKLTEEDINSFSDPNSLIYKKLWQGKDDIGEHVKERSKMVVAGRAAKRKQVQERKKSKEQEQVLEEEQEPESGLPDTPDKVTQSQLEQSTTGAANVEESFVTEEEVALSLERKRPMQSSSRASVASVASSHRSLHQAPGFAITPSKLRFMSSLRRSSPALGKPASPPSPVGMAGMATLPLLTPPPPPTSSPAKPLPFLSPAPSPRLVKKKKKITNVIGF